MKIFNSKLATVALTSSLICGCSTIKLENSEAEGSTTSTESEWHHIAFFDLVEVSSAVDLEEACEGGEWRSVQTETSFVNGLASFAVNLWGPWWYPQTVTVECAEQRD